MRTLLSVSCKRNATKRSCKRKKKKLSTSVRINANVRPFVIGGNLRGQHDSHEYS